jgi:molybdopterin biosynthesis enzyme
MAFGLIIIGDDPARITALLDRSFAGPDIVFSRGGIGARPDDHARQCAAAALGLPLALHPESLQPHPGFTVMRHPGAPHHFVQGVPVMAWPGVNVFSLPSVGDGKTRRHIELGVKGDPVQVDAAFDGMCKALARMGAEYKLHS